MKTHSLLARLVALLALVAAPACDINVNDSDGDDSDGMGSSSGDDSDGSASGNGSGNDSDDSDDSDGDDDSDGGSSGGDDPTGDSGAGGDGPGDGLWIYADDGASRNDCTFFPATQGVGDFAVDNHGDGTFTIAPGDDSDPFDCQMSDGGKFECPERYVESISEPGISANLEALVTVEGTTSNDEMEGEQLGRIVCDGADCSIAEDFLGTTFPCTFVIPFTAFR